MSSRGVFLFLAAGVLAACLFVNPAPVFSQPVFVVETVDSDGDVGTRTSIAIDSGDMPHIGYIDHGNADLKYARRMEMGWVTELAHTAGYRESDTGLVLDSADRPAMVCGGGPAYYVFKDGASWVAEHLDGYAVWYSTLALDTNDNPRILYNWSLFKEWESRVAYAIRVGPDDWSETTIGGGPFTPSGPDYELVIDGNNNRHVAAIANFADTLRYSYRSSTATEYAVFTPAAHCALAVDEQNNPSIAYYDTGLAALVFVAKLQGSWRWFLVDSSGDVGRYCSLAVGTDGSWHIAYFDDTNDDLKYARRGGLTGAWEISVVDSDGVVGQYTSIALDSANRPHIAYQDMTNSNLKYAVLDVYLPAKKATWGGLKDLLRDR
jgi:hypothetical protein